MTRRGMVEGLGDLECSFWCILFASDRRKFDALFTEMQ